MLLGHSNGQRSVPWEEGPKLLLKIEVAGLQVKKIVAVLRLLRGEDLLSREPRVNAATLSSWRDVFLANGLAGLKSREVDARDEKIGALQEALTETALNLEISREINRVCQKKLGPLATWKSTK
jgi:hypothetical protein